MDRSSRSRARGRGRLVDAIVATLNRHGSDSSAIVVSSAPGQGCSALLGAIGDRLRRDGFDVARVAPVGSGMRPETPECTLETPDGARERIDVSMLDFLTAVRDRANARRVVLLVDDAHALSLQDAAALVAWCPAARDDNIPSVVAWHPAAAAFGMAAVLASLPRAEVVELDPPSDEDIWSIVRGSADWPSSVRDWSLSACQGIPEVAEALALALSSPTLEDPIEELRQAALTALGSLAARVLDRQPSGAWTFALVTAFVRPEGTTTEAGALLGVAPMEIQRLSGLMRQLGLLPSDRRLHDMVREAVAATAPDGARARAGRVAADYLGRVHACPTRVFDTLELARNHADERYLEAAQAAFQVRWESNDVDSARQIAERLRLQAPQDHAAAWATRSLMMIWLDRDWRSAATAIQRGAAADPATLDAFESERVPVELSLEAPAETLDVVRSATAAGRPASAVLLHRQLLTGAPVDPLAVARASSRAEPHALALAASALVVRTVVGAPAETALSAMAAAVREMGVVNIDASVAASLALAHLAMGSDEDADEWATIAVTTELREKRASRALAHLVSAYASMRADRMTSATEHAESARELFGQLGAGRLLVLADTVRLHIAVECGEDTTGSAEPQPTHGVPLLDTYLSYVAARRRLSTKHDADVARGLFDTGRRLGALGIRNPSLMNWRSHLAAVFHASNRAQLALSVEADLRDAIRSWGRHNPEAATRLASRLGSSFGQSGTEDRTGELGPSPHHWLSAAEERVVRLVSQGRSNRDVAAALYLSKRTVDTHLSNVYRKLGVASRSDLAQALEVHDQLAGRGPAAAIGYG